MKTTIKKNRNQMITAKFLSKVKLEIDYDSLMYAW